jgi:hypothetical protein
LKEPYAFLAAVLTTCAIVIALCLIIITIALVNIQLDVAQFVDGDAWNAPWINVIERGPVE